MSRSIRTWRGPTPSLSPTLSLGCCQPLIVLPCHSVHLISCLICYSPSHPSHHSWKLECRYKHEHIFTYLSILTLIQAHTSTLTLTNAHTQMHTFIYSHRYPLFLINWKSMGIKAHGQNPNNSQCSSPGAAGSGTEQGLQPLTCSDLIPG